MLPWAWDAGNKLLFRILQDELGIDLEQKLLVYKMANLKARIYLNYDMIFFLSCILSDIGFAPGLNVCSRQLTAYKASAHERLNSHYKNTILCVKLMRF